jgi:hypothetical protein
MSLINKRAIGAAAVLCGLAGTGTAEALDVAIAGFIRQEAA